MAGKFLNGNVRRNSFPATLSPGDFPLGSILSRAAARSILATLAPPQDDLDAVCLFKGVALLNARMDPSYAELERTAAYARGRQLRQESKTAGCDFDSAGSGVAWKVFHMAFGRNPEQGDLIRYEDVKAARSPIWHVWLVKEFSAAWNRQIPSLPCPFRVEDESRVFRRLGPTAAKENRGQEWEEDIGHRHEADVVWSLIEQEAQDRNIVQDPEQIPTIAGVTFTGSKWRPATKRELREVEIEPSGGILGLLAKAANRIKSN